VNWFYKINVPIFSYKNHLKRLQKPLVLKKYRKVIRKLHPVCLLTQDLAHVVLDLHRKLVGRKVVDVAAKGILDLFRNQLDAH
jgi:hypothetical protein